MYKTAALLVCTFAAAGALAQETQEVAAPVAAAPMRAVDPVLPIVPAVKPPLGAASRASRHEWHALERQQRTAEKEEDRRTALAGRKARTERD